MSIDNTTFPELQFGFAGYLEASKEPLLFLGFNPGNPADIITHDPSKFLYEKPFIFVQMISSENGVVNLSSGIVSAQYTQSRTASGTQIDVRIAASQFRVETGERDVAKWYSENPNLLVYVYKRRIGVADQTPFDTGWSIATIGQIDDIQYVFEEDVVTISARDLSHRLWDFDVFETFLNTTPRKVIEKLADILKLRVTARGIDGIEVPTILTEIPDPDTGALPPLPSILDTIVGFEDADGSGNRRLWYDGVKAWDVVQSLAQYTDSSAFVMNGTLFFIPENMFIGYGGIFKLTWKKNIVALNYDHSAYQSKDITVIMGVHNPKGWLDDPNNNAIVTEGLSEKDENLVLLPNTTYYFTMSDVNTVNMDSLPPDTFDGGNRVYRVMRYNLTVQQAAKELAGIYRQAAQREFVLRVKISGHEAANIFPAYTLAGTDSLLDNQTYTAKHISHSYDVKSGWTSDIILTNAKYVAGVLGANSGGAFPLPDMLSRHRGSVLSPEEIEDMREKERQRNADDQIRRERERLGIDDSRSVVD